MRTHLEDNRQGQYAVHLLQDNRKTRYYRGELNAV